MKKIRGSKSALRTAVLTAAAGTVTLLGCGTGFAATNAAAPAQITPAAHQRVVAARPQPRSGQRGQGQGRAQGPQQTGVGHSWTQGFNVYNYSAETFKYEKTSGSLPAPDTSDFLPGQKRNFELPVHFGTHTSGTAYYDMYGANNGPQIGTMTIALNSDDSWTVMFWDMSGNQDLALTVPDSDYSTTLHIEDAAWSDAAKQTYTPGSTDEANALQQICAANASACTFQLDSETTGHSSQKLIAQAYNAAGATGPAELQTEKGYTDTTTTQWGGTVQVGGSILSKVDVQVQAQYSHSVANSTNFQTDYQIPVGADQTGYIYLEVPEYIDSGTFTVHLGNTTWTLPGVQFHSGNSNGVDEYASGYAPGDVPQVLDAGVHN